MVCKLHLDKTALKTLLEGRILLLMYRLEVIMALCPSHLSQHKISY